MSGSRWAGPPPTRTSTASPPCCPAWSAGSGRRWGCESRARLPRHALSTARDHARQADDRRRGRGHRHGARRRPRRRDRHPGLVPDALAGTGLGDRAGVRRPPRELIGSARPGRYCRSVSELVSKADRITVLTGAGISTGSGIPDFRGPQGLWTKNPAAQAMFDLDSYISDRDVRVQLWGLRVHHPAWTAEPNAAHLAL